MDYDDIIIAFIGNILDGKPYAIKPTDISMEYLVTRAAVLCPNTPGYIFEMLLA